jgi:phage shock protein C
VASAEAEEALAAAGAAAESGRTYNSIGGIMVKRLYRSSQNRMIAGICGGIAEYFNIDPSIVRLAWIIFAVMGGAGVLAYIICAVVIPNDKDVTS